MSNDTGTQKSLDQSNFDDVLSNGNDLTAIETAEAYPEKIAEKLTAVKLKVSENLAGAAEKMHQQSDVAQDYLIDKSDKVNTFAHHTIEKANHIGHRAAEALDASSGYVKDFHLTEKREQVMSTVRERPELSLAIAGICGVAIGLLIGRTFKK